MKILVTGGAGFIGSNITDAYIALGHKVAIIDNLSSGKRPNINPKARFCQMDINSDRVGGIFAKEKFDVVNHHAAQIDVRKSVTDPAFDAKVNIMGSLNLFENAKKYGVKKIIFSSSGGTIYGECGQKAPDELSKANPLSPYGIAKYSVEFYLKYYHSVHGLKYTILRYGNVYGPRQDPHGEAGVIAIFSGKMLDGETVNIFGDGKQMRDYVYVADVVKANVLAIKKGDNEIINIGTGKATSVNRVVKEMSKIISLEEEPVCKPAGSGELFKSFLKIEKARRILKWKPEVPLCDGLKKTIEYFKKVRS